MELQSLLFDLTVGLVRIYSGMILLFTKNKSQIQTGPYRMAKKYMVTFLVFAGAAIISASIFKMFFEEEVDCLCIYTLSNHLVGAILLLFSFTCLFDYKERRFRVAFVFFPVALVLFYYISKSAFIGPEVESITELLRKMQVSSSFFYRFFMELFIALGIVIMLCTYFQCRKAYSYRLKDCLSGYELAKIRWIDKMFVFMILMGVFSILNYVISWYYYSYVHEILITMGMVYYTVSFINYRQLKDPTGLMAVQTDQILVDKESGIGINSAKEKQKCDTPEEAKLFDEAYHFARRAVEKWVNSPEKPFLKAGITLKDAALGIGLSRRKLSDFVKNEYSCNFNMWINTLRIKEVERILSEDNKNLSLSYIADCTGFSDLPGMSNTFKKIVGVSPSQYRNRLMKKAFEEELAAG